METLLLAKADFKDFADLPESLDLDRLRPHILAVQRTRLRPLLTGALYDELLRRVDLVTPTTPLTAPWSDLLKEAVPVLACASMARYMPFALTTQTATGFRVKNSQYSDAADGRDLARMASIYDGDALTHEVALAAWLSANGSRFGSFYPPATCGGAGQPARTPSVVVQAIGRPNDRPGNFIPFGR